MKKRIQHYLKYYNEITQPENLDSISENDRKNLQKECLVQIGFFQHERLVHLIVTVLFSILFVATGMLCLYINRMELFILTGLFLVLLVPYIFHYYRLENGVQRLYEYYDVLSGMK